MNFTNYTVIKDRDCTGCGLCAFVCPQKCIALKEGKLGHLFPFVDEKLCVHCNLCTKVCPSSHEVSHFYPIKAYAAWAKDNQEYLSSTSGGAASVLSRNIIKRGGVIYGCAMLPECDVRHIRVEDEDDLYKLKGSKYVQSNLANIFSLLKNDVKSGRLVLFIGTPCQVAAIKSMFSTMPENLLLVDIVCHGVPSLSLFHNHLKSRFGKVRFDSISFRQGNTMNLRINDNGKVIYNSHYKDDWYYKLFMNGFTYRDSCHYCKYAQPNRVSDITIGDFWGLGKMGNCNIPKQKDGISVLLPITEKGVRLIHDIQDQMNLYERPIEEAIRGNAQLMHPTPYFRRIFLFQKLESFFGIETAYKLAHADIYLKSYLKLI